MSSSSKKIVFIGNTVWAENKYLNFFPQYKKINNSIIPLDEEDRERWFSSFPQINIGSREPKDSPELHKKFGSMLKEYAEHICTVTISREDIFSTKNGKLRLPFCDLMEREDIKRISFDESDFYKVTTTNEVYDWDKDDARIISLNEELTEGKRYFLECDDGFFRGPFEYKTVGKKKGLFVPKNKTPEILTEFYTIFVDGYKSEKVVYLPSTIVDDGNDTIEPPINPDEKKDEDTTYRKKVKEERNKLAEKIMQFRNYDKNEIYNILICITQGFLTVFAGEPGTGKTSICDTIAKILGLSSTDDTKNRYLSISVERGWTSKNDLIGYYNPLTEKFTDSTGLYAALTKLDKENTEEKCFNPYFVLLDEANLSQMEHYWASFIKLADANARREAKLSLAPRDSKNVICEVVVPDTLKFLATINNDHTTENLSPRLLDRAWIITLPIPKGDFENKTADMASDCITWETLTNLFGADATTESTTFDSAKNEIEVIYGLYEKNRRTVSPRSKIAIDNYLKVALDCFDGDDDVVRSAIDFVIMQKLLPMLNGYIAEAFAKELQEILNENYPMSSAKFEDMRSQNDNMDNTYVSFFM